jgi:ABC-2 type transport system ATP-binding protein
MHAIELSDLTKRYGDVTALDELSLTVEEGEIYGFLGPNGAGKSTTINILLGFTNPTSGTASVLDLAAHDHSKQIREHTGALLEGYGVYERITPSEHLERAIATKEADDDPDELLDRVGIADIADRRADTLSKGIRQRLALAIALVGDPDLLVLDEPSTGLDPNGIRRLREIIREENRRGATVFFSSHIIDQVEAVCDRIGIIQNGSVVTAGDVDELRGDLDAATLTVSVEWVPDPLLADLREMPDVSEVTATDSQLVVACRGGDTKLAVLNRVDRAGVGYRDFTVDEPSLDDVFSRATEDARIAEVRES